MDNICKNCKSDELSFEVCDTVCTSCGEVQDLPTCDLYILQNNNANPENSKAKTREAHQRLTERIRNETNSSETRRLICRSKVLNDVRRVTKQLIMHASALDETMDLINSTFQLYKGRLLCSKKYGLVGACIYYMSAKHQLGISLVDICRALNLKMKVISVCLKQVRQLSPNLEFSRPSINDLVKRSVDELATKKYSPFTVEAGNSVPSRLEPEPLIHSRDCMILEHRTLLLIDLFEAMHPYNRPAPQNMITALLYHAWKSLDTFKIIATNLTVSDKRRSLNSDPFVIERQAECSGPTRTQFKHKIGYERFCQICSFKYSPNANSIVTKIQSSLLILGKYLGDVNKINLPFYLEDIIENSANLIQEHKNRGDISS